MSEFKTNDKFYPFAVSADGRVKNLKTGKDYIPNIGTHGYYVVASHLLHRMVATLFVENPDNKNVVNHKDCNKLNNHYSNLEWVTFKENSIHARDNGRLKINCDYGEDCNLTIYPDSLIHSICQSLSDGMRNIDVAKKYNVPKSYIKQLKAKKSRYDITSQYEMGKYNKKSVSDTTVEWVCVCIVKGMSQTEIVQAANNKLVTVNLIKNIRRKSCYKSISDKYF